MLRAFGHRVAMCCDMLGVVGSILTIFKFEPTCRNTVAKRTQHVGPNSVAICCVGMLRSLAGALGLGPQNFQDAFGNLWNVRISLVCFQKPW